MHKPSPPHLSADLLDAPDAYERLDSACREWGFFYLSDHGLTLCDELLAETVKFFAQSDAEKQGVARTDRNPWGYYDKELTKNERDWKEIYDVGPDYGEETAQWPASQVFKQVITQHASEAQALSERIIIALARCLGAEPDQCLSQFASHSSFTRLNHYAPCPTPLEDNQSLAGDGSGRLGIQRHTDAGAVTILLQDDVAGLQVWNDGQWHTIDPLPGSVVVNVGDVVQVWSNDRYIAPLHRVRANSRCSRYSIAYFCNPSYSASYAPLLDSPRYRPILWSEFRALRAAGDYADQGEEVQISHYRI